MTPPGGADPQAALCRMLAGLWRTSPGPGHGWPILAATCGQGIIQIYTILHNLGYFLKTFFLKKSGFPPFFGPLGPPGPCRDLGNALLSISASPFAERPYSRRPMILFAPTRPPAVVTPKMVMGLFPALTWLSLQFPIPQRPQGLTKE